MAKKEEELAGKEQELAKKEDELWISQSEVIKLRTRYSAQMEKICLLNTRLNGQETQIDNLKTRLYNNEEEKMRCWMVGFNKFILYMNNTNLAKCNAQKRNSANKEGWCEATKDAKGRPSKRRTLSDPGNAFSGCVHSAIKAAALGAPFERYLKKKKLFF